MIIEESPIKGAFIMQPKVFEDHRGYFFESFSQRQLDQVLGFSPHFVQDNQSRSNYGVIRGLHLQVGVHAQAKLVRALEGTILDVIVDVRPASAQFGEVFVIELSGENKTQLFIPKGFAHGFAVLSETATIHYKADNYYNRDSESGLLYNDPVLNIDWQLKQDEIMTSEKDLLLPTLEEFRRRQVQFSN
jgi:dTDP-4-dehydrorhamnose 3,5-epimerase